MLARDQDGLSVAQPVARARGVCGSHAQTVSLGERYSPNYVLVEDAASGQSLIQMLRSETRLPILPVKPLGDKVARAHAVAPLVESGRVFLPDQTTWLRDLIDELCASPRAARRLGRRHDAGAQLPARAFVGVA